MDVPSLLILLAAIAIIVLFRTWRRKRALRSRRDLTVRGRYVTMQPVVAARAEAGAAGNEQLWSTDASSAADVTTETAAAQGTPYAPISDAHAAYYQERFQEAARLIAHGDFDNGFTIATEVLEFARAGGYLALSGAALSILADVHRHRGDLAAAEACTAASLVDTRQANPHPWMLAISVASAAENAYLRRDLEEAEHRYREALELIGTASEHPLYLMAIERLAECEFNHGNLPQAKRLQQRALEFHEARGNASQAIGALRNLGMCDRAMGQFEDACRTFHRCHDEALAAGDLLTAHIALGEEGITYAAANNHERAATVLRQSLDLQREHRLIAGGTIAQIALCRSLLALARPTEALAAMEGEFSASVFEVFRR